MRFLVLAGLVVAPILGSAQLARELQQVEAAEEAVRRAPDSEPARIALATLYLQLGQNRRASETLTTYLQGHSQSPRTLRLLAAASLRQEDFAAARDFAGRARGLEPRDTVAVHLLAMAHLGLQDEATAEHLFREALSLDPQSVDTNFQLGLLYTRRHEELPEALSLLRHSEALQPKAAGTHTALGSVLLQLNRPEEAAGQLEIAVSLDPQSSESYYLLAEAYRRLGKATKADTALAEFRARNADSAEARAREMRSRSFYEEGSQLLANTDRLDAAFEALQKAVQAKPDFDAAYYRMAQVRYLQDDLAGGAKLVREALRLNAIEPEYYFVLARCLEQSDRPAALAAIRTALRLRPGVADFQELLKSLETEKAK